ncbi:response regulator [Nocardioides sp. KIGAM211]|uniref:Circadian input-output histidine kinase CikA n=1 Tax=Nocardioides luti TaxID=2761101 RepID=A0A7X0VC58_9ACTN|nr:response regulator [Nocardioides luti]MBB6629411.1 response regulator [Nocardioides luti]
MDLTTLYRDIVETSPDGIWVFDLEGRTLYANPELARMFGVEASELTGLTYFDSLDEVGRGQFAAHLENVRAGRTNETDVESQFVRRDGSVFWVLVSESALHGPDGEITAVVHRISDYQGRRQLLDEVRTSQRRLEEAQRIARIGSWEWDVERDEISGSPELFALYGLDPASFPAAYDDFLGIVHPNDRAEVDAAVRSALDGAETFIFVARVQGEDDWVWTRGRGVAFRDESGKVVGMSGTHQDITEAKQAEEALEDSFTQNALMQAVAVAANEARTLTDVLGHARSLVLLHDDWERARGFVPTPDGRAVVPLYLSDADREADEATPEATAMEIALANRAVEVRGSVWDDSRLTIAFPVLFDDEICAVVTITSAPPLYRHEMIQTMVEQVAVQLGRVAERERAERALASARDDAMEASRQKSEFLATMSHEIRTPLNGVIGLNDLLLRTGLDPDQARLASGVQVASRALLSVINDVLDFSKIEAGKLELERLDFEVRPVFDQVASVLSESARAKGLELVISCHPDVPEVLSGDPTRLAQVLTNLGSNAVKFTEHGEVFVRATASPTDGGGTELHVEVTDTGVGLDDVDVDALFDPFTQADASTTRVYGGTGLGLAIAREIVDALGGEIGLRPNPVGGSVFWFTARFEAPTGAATDPDDEYARAWLQGKRVLVVDDHDHNRQILAEQLEWWQVRSIGVGSADTAMEALHAAHSSGDPFEAVLLDLAMPFRDGLDLAGQIRSVPAYDDLVLVMLTSITAPDPERVAQHRIAACLTKPVLSGVLRGTLLGELAGVGPRASTAAAAPGPAHEQHRVLVVEDNPVNQMVAVGLLEALGYVAVTADDGLVALDLLAEQPFDLVLMDVQMPRMDGYDATREIRAHETPAQRMPVIAMTAAAVEGERERCLAAGMDDFLTKPVDPSALTHVLDRWLQKEPTMTVPPDASPEPTEPRPLFEGLDLPRIDELRDLDPGDTTYLDRAIGNFVANSVTTMATLRELHGAGDAEQLKYVAHKLAGGALNLGVTPAGRIAQQLEIAAEGGDVDAAGSLLEDLDTALEQGRSAVLAYQASYSTNGDRA